MSLPFEKQFWGICKILKMGKFAASFGPSKAKKLLVSWQLCGCSVSHSAWCIVSSPYPRYILALHARHGPRMPPLKFHSGCATARLSSIVIGTRLIQSLFLHCQRRPACTVYIMCMRILHRKPFSGAFDCGRILTSFRCS